MILRLLFTSISSFLGYLSRPHICPPEKVYISCKGFLFLGKQKQIRNTERQLFCSLNPSFNLKRSEFSFNLPVVIPFSSVYKMEGWEAGENSLQHFWEHCLHLLSFTTHILLFLMEERVVQKISPASRAVRLTLNVYHHSINARSKTIDCTNLVQSQSTFIFLKTFVYKPIKTKFTSNTYCQTDLAYIDTLPGTCKCKIYGKGTWPIPFLCYQNST